MQFSTINLPDLLDRSNDVLKNIRTQKPLVQCLTNMVSMHYLANALLSVGASPAMVIAKEDSIYFTPQCQSVLINIGTLTPLSLEQMLGAVEVADKNKIPWVLDPISAGSPFRLSALRQLIEYKPTVIRGNAGEIIELAKILPDCEAAPTVASPLKGIDSQLDSHLALSSAIRIAKTHNTFVAISGSVDRLTDGNLVLNLSGGSPWMTRVTSIGCSMNGIIAAALGVTHSPLISTLSIMMLFKQIGEELSDKSLGLGNLSSRFIDALETTSLSKKFFFKSLKIETL